MVRLKVQYDGKVLIPDRPVELPRGVPLDATIETLAPEDGSTGLLDLAGLGADVWADVDPVEYQRREREGWS